MKAVGTENCFKLQTSEARRAKPSWI